MKHALYGMLLIQLCPRYFVNITCSILYVLPHLINMPIKNNNAHVRVVSATITGKGVLYGFV